MHNAGILLGGQSNNQQKTVFQLQFSTVRLLFLAGHFDSFLAMRSFFLKIFSRLDISQVPGKFINGTDA